MYDETYMNLKPIETLRDFKEALNSRLYSGEYREYIWVPYNEAHDAIISFVGKLLKNEEGVG